MKLSDKMKEHYVKSNLSPPLVNARILMWTTEVRKLEAVAEAAKALSNDVRIAFGNDLTEIETLGEYVIALDQAIATLEDGNE